MRFYYSKNSSSLAAHILLFEVEAKFESVEVSIEAGAHVKPEFLAVNPKGRVPALETEKGVLTENPAILEFVASTHLEAALVPEGHFEQARARSLCAYLCATAHVAFAHGFRGARWADDPNSFEDMASKVPINMQECAAFLDREIGSGPWAMGESYSYCDPYLNQFHRWMDKADLDYVGCAAMSAHRAAMAERPATQRAYALYGLA